MKKIMFVVIACAWIAVIVTTKPLISFPVMVLGGAAWLFYRMITLK